MTTVMGAVRRNAELGLILLAGLLTAGAYVLASLGRRARWHNHRRTWSNGRPISRSTAGSRWFYPSMRLPAVGFRKVLCWRTCNACWFCLVAKATTRCPRRKVYGITYGLNDGLCGGWAEQIYLKPGTRCLRLAADAETFMAGGCALPTALHAIERGEIAIGDTVLVLGSGPVGISAIILSLMGGALRVLCIGAPDQRLEAATQVGASAVLNFEEHEEGERLEWVREQTHGRGADVTIEATGAPDAVVQAMRFTRDAGRVVVVGQYTDHGPVSTKAGFNPHLDLNKKHLDVRGCWGSDFSHFYRGTQIISDPVRSAPWASLKPQLSRYALSDANDALAAVAEGRVLKALIDSR